MIEINIIIALYVCIFPVPYNANDDICPFSALGTRTKRGEYAYNWNDDI